MPFEYTYKEGGTVVDVKPEVSYTKRPRMTATGTINNVLKESDLGDWRIRAEIKVSDHTETGDGTAWAETTFTVIKAENLPIKISEGRVEDTIVAGQGYMCSHYNPAHFYFPVPQGSYQYKLEWKVTDSIDPDTKFVEFADPTDSHKAVVQGLSEGTDIVNAKLFVGSNEHGFTLSADMVVYDGDTLNVKYHYTGKLHVNVITNIEITSPPATVIKGNTYPLEANIVVWSVNGNGEHSSTYLVDGSKYICWNDGLKKQWTIAEDQTDTTISVYLDHSDNIPFFMSESNNLLTSKSIKVQEAPYTFKLSDSEGGKEKEIFTDEEIELIVTSTINNEEYTPYNIDWKCRRKEDNAVVYPVYKNGSDIKHKIIDMSQLDPGEYEITASYVYNNVQKRTSNTYTIKVKKYTVTAAVLAVDNKTTISANESTQIYLQLMNEKGQTTGSVNWRCSDKGKTNTTTWYQSDVKADGPITIIAYDTEETVVDTWTANYTLKNGETGTAQIKITVTPK